MTAISLLLAIFAVVIVFIGASHVSDYRHELEEHLKKPLSRHPTKIFDVGDLVETNSKWTSDDCWEGWKGLDRHYGSGAVTQVKFDKESGNWLASFTTEDGCNKTLWEGWLQLQ